MEAAFTVVFFDHDMHAQFVVEELPRGVRLHKIDRNEETCANDVLVISDNVARVPTSLHWESDVYRASNVILDRVTLPEGVQTPFVILVKSLPVTNARLQATSVHALLHRYRVFFASGGDLAFAPWGRMTKPRRASVKEWDKRTQAVFAALRAQDCPCADAEEAIDSNLRSVPTDTSH